MNHARDEGIDAVFSRLGLDVRTPDGLHYDIMSGTQSNITAHARREAEELFRMITF